jgi:hypothetical protein
MESKGYTLIQDWMLDLPISYREIAIYAIIYGFSQDGETRFEGSLGYLARKTKASKNTARAALHKLMDEGLIERTIVNKNGVEFNTYKATLAGSAKIGGGVQKLEEGGAISAPNNIDNNKDINKTTNKRAAAFVTPTLTEIEDYCRERQNSVDAERFLNYYEANGWMVGRNKMKDWKAAVRTWEQRENARPVQPKQKQSRTAYYNELAAQIMGGLKND